MAETTYSTQIRYTGGGPLDVKLQPVATYNDLSTIPRAQRYIGMVVTVLSDINNNGTMTDYWLVGGTTNTSWVKKPYGEVSVSGDDVQ